MLLSVKKAFIAFTLAEVLITIAVIGIVAVLTIPALNNQIKDLQYKSAAKKAYAEISQAVALIKQDEGGTLPQTYYTTLALKNALVQKMNVSLNCLPANCINTSSFNPPLNSLYGVASLWYQDDGQFMTTDGMFFGCDVDRDTVAVDVNGYNQGPNSIGKDIFYFKLVNDNIVPMGATGTDFPAPAYCTRSAANGWTQGLGCMFYVLNGIDY